MKNTLLSALAVLLSISFSNNTLYAQAGSLTLVTNPDNGLGYTGGTVEYNNDLYFVYRNASSGSQLASYNGDTIILIPNPVSGGVQAPLVVYNNLLYLLYYNRTTEVYQIATYNGSSITLIANPDASASPFAAVTIYNNKLCFQYNTELAEYDGTTWKMFSPPQPGGFTFQGGLTVYNNKLYMGYQTTANVRQLMQFDGTTITLIPNPDGATAFSPLDGGYQGWPIIYNNKLYIKYVAITGVTHLAQYDGTSVTLIPNADASPYGYGYGTGGFPCIYDNKLYIQYLNASHITQLAAYNGTSMSLVANPDGGNGYQGAPIVYDSSLFIQYQDSNSIYRLGKYNGTSLTLIHNPDKSPYGYANYTSTGAYITPPILYGPYIKEIVRPGYYLYNLYIQYEDSMGINRLAQYNDTVLTLIRNPDTTKLQNAAGNTGYKGSAVVFNNSLYVQYYSAKNNFNLAYLHIDSVTTLPVTLLNFTVQPKGDANLLHWQTATEINTNYFNVQRSIPGGSFATIGKVNAAGNSNTLLDYYYTDELSAINIPPVIYYRLQEVDKDGNITYSNVVAVRTTGGKGGFVIAPNPVASVINVLAGADAPGAVITLEDINGKILYSTKQDVTAGQKIQINAGTLAKGMYIVTIKNSNASYKLKVIKGQ